MILLALGSNLKSSFGDRFKNIDLAVSALKEHDINREAQREMSNRSK